MVAQADRMAGVLLPVRQQIVGLEVLEHRPVDVRAGDARPEDAERNLLGGDGVVEQPPHLVRGPADDHRPLELGVVAPDRRARLADEHVAFPELDVVGDGVRPGAPEADLAAVPRRDAVGRGLLAAVRRAERLEHGESRLVARLQARLGLGRTRPRVPLEQLVREAAPPAALADQRHLGLALAHQYPFDERCEESDAIACDLAQRRPLVAQDAGIAVLVGADGAAQPHVDQNALQDSHRMLGARVLRVGLDPVEVRLRAHPVDLELGNEGGQVAGRVRDDRDGSLSGKENKPREVLDVVLVEQHAPGETLAAHVVEQPLPPRRELSCRNSGE